MGEAKRRQSKAEWAEGVQQLHAESGGTIKIELLRPPDIWREPKRVSLILASWLRGTRDVDPPVLCLLCDRVPPTPPAALLVAAGAIEAPEHGLFCGLCESCARHSDEDLMRRGVEKLRGIWPDLRVLDLTNLHTTGGAA